MRGRVRNISLPRRFIIDLMHASMGVPFVTLSRSVDVRHLIEARMAAGRAPGWAAIFVKAFAIVATEEPVLRTLYAKWPRPHFYELPRSIAMVAIGRVEDGEDCILPERVLAPDEQPLAQIHAQIHRAKRAPVEDIPFFRRIYKATGCRCRCAVSAGGSAAMSAAGMPTISARSGSPRSPPMAPASCAPSARAHIY
jgi:hypothetical protein